MRYLSVCSGMEAASVAWHPLGFTPVGFSEIEPFPCAILKHRFPNTPNYGSLTEYKQWPLEPGAIDLLVGGTPCQSFSVAGLRKGLDDPRGNLCLMFLGIADKLKPRWLVFENVPGLLSSNGGKDFGAFLGALVELGYGFAYRVLDAQHFGVPQRRRRIILVACLGDWRAPAEVLLEPDCVRRDIKKGRAKGQSPASGAQGGVDSNGLQRTVGTLCADTHPGAYSGQDAYTGRLIPSHWDGGEIHPTLNQAHNIGSPGYSNQELFSQKGAGLVPAIPIHDQATRHSGKRGDKQDGKGNGFGIGQPGDPMNTLTKGDKHAVFIPMAVRRLTPVETERLQGFPDNWSRISWKGKPEEQCPDGPRYKACGNSMAVPVMRWIGERIAEADAKHFPIK